MPVAHVNLAGMDMAGVGSTQTGCVSDPTHEAKPPSDMLGQGRKAGSITNGAQVQGSMQSNKRGREEGDDGRDREISRTSNVRW